MDAFPLFHMSSDRSLLQRDEVYQVAFRRGHVVRKEVD